MKLTSILLVILLGIAVSLTKENEIISKENEKLKEYNIQTEWVKAQVELRHENKNYTVVEDGKE